MTPGGSVESRQGVSRRAESVSSTGFVFPNDTNHHSTIFGRRVLSRTCLSVRMDTFAQQNKLASESAQSSALTMVAFNAAGKLTPVPRLIVETKEERADYEQAVYVREVAIQRSRRKGGEAV